MAGGQPTDYTYDEAAGLPVLLEDGQRKYVWGRGLLYSTNPAGTAVSSVYQRDGLGTVRALTDGTGALTDTRDVDAFGLPTRSQGPSAQPFGFAGEQRDAETGLVYLRARYYDPGLGRFLQRDPLAGRLTRPGTLNRYTYGRNNPVRYTDPSGFEEDEPDDFADPNEPSSDPVLSDTITFMQQDDQTVADFLGTYLTMLEGQPTQALEPVLFGQARVSEHFTTTERNPNVPAELSGRSVYDVAADLRAGTLSPDVLAIQAFRHEDTGQLISANTRSLTALSLAGLEPTNVTIVDPTGPWLNRLGETSALGDSLPSTRIAITPSMSDRTILDVVSIPSASAP